MKILIIKYGALGDIIMATPVIRRVLDHHAGADIWLLTEPAFVPLFEGWKNLSIRALPRKGPGAWWQTLVWIRSQAFDRLIDLQSSDRSGLLCALSGVPDRAGNHPRFPYHRHPAERYRGQCHAFERLNQILRACDIEPAHAAPFLPAPAAVQDRVHRWITDQGLAPYGLVLLHAGASRRHPQKRWPGFAGLAAELSRQGYMPVWIGGPDDRELNRELAQVAGVDAGELFSILDLAELGRHARFAVTNDSAPMHILSGAGIPVYGLFGPTDWRRTHALGQEQRVIAMQAGTEGSFRPAGLEHLSVGHVLSRLRGDGLVT